MTGLRVVSAVMLSLVHSVFPFLLSVTILVAILAPPALFVVFLSVVVMFGDVTEAGNQRKCH